eukprot:c19917_g1_i1 orf=706-1806(+)
MAGIALAFDLLSNNTALPFKCVQSFATLSAVSAAAAAASAVAFLPCYPAYSSRLFLRDYFEHVVHCEEAVGPERWRPEWSPELIVTDEKVENAEGWDPNSYPATTITGVIPAKSYPIELKPIFSAFCMRSLLGTTCRALLLNFKPVIEAYLELNKPVEDEEIDVDETPPKPLVDYVTTLKNSARYMVRELSVVTTRRILERIAVHYASQRTAWKLLKDLPKSAQRKAGRHISHLHLFVGMTKTTFRGHALGIVANWLVQLVQDFSKCFHNLYLQIRNGKSTRVNNEARCLEREMQKLCRTIAGNTAKCGSSLVFASIGAGLGSVLIRPSSGQWLGCAAGEYAGTILVGFWIDSWIVYGTFTPPEDQ